MPNILQIIAQRKYAKWKAAYINNCLKNGETPIPGPVGGTDDDIQTPSGPATGLPYPEQPPSNMPDLPPSVVYPPGGAAGHTEPTAQYQPPAVQYPPQPQSYTAANTQPLPVSTKTF